MPQDTPRGVRDFSPAEAISRKYIIGVVEEIFKRFGFDPLETPAMEKKAILTAKAYGEESTKELFEIEGEDDGLRYDFTVPLARYVASNRDIALPFKRFQIGSIWRKEEPQKMRYREFTQADIDIVGSTEIDSDAEVVAAAAMALEALGIRNYILLINDRRLLAEILTFFKIPQDKQKPVMRILDKMQKISRQEILEMFAKTGINSKAAEELLNFLEQKGDNDAKIQRVSSNVDGAREYANKIKEMISLLGGYGLSGQVEIDFALVRGLDYYTGPIFEFVIEENGKRLPTICGGGRYDKLIGIYAKKEIPAVGIGMGISRLYDLAGSKNAAKTYAKVFIAFIGERTGTLQSTPPPCFAETAST